MEKWRGEVFENRNGKFLCVLVINNPDFRFDVRNGRINRKNTANFSREENNYESTGENFRDLFDYF